MEFLNPNFLYLLIVLIVLIAMRIVFFSKRNASLQVSNVESLKIFFNKGATFKIFLLNSLFVIATNMCGTHHTNRKTYGYSLLVNPWGKIINECKKNLKKYNIKNMKLAKKFIKSISTIKKYFSDRKILICKEITKYFEEYFRNSVKNLNEFQKNLKGLIITTGPGSYTSLRVGAAFIAGLKYSKNIKTASVSSEIISKLLISDNNKINDNILRSETAVISSLSIINYLIN